MLAGGTDRGSEHFTEARCFFEQRPSPSEGDGWTVCGSKPTSLCIYNRKDGLLRKRLRRRRLTTPTMMTKTTTDDSDDDDSDDDDSDDDKYD